MRNPDYGPRNHLRRQVEENHTVSGDEEERQVWWTTWMYFDEILEGLEMPVKS
jgi:hypothetical protein